MRGRLFTTPATALWRLRNKVLLSYQSPPALTRWPGLRPEAKLFGEDLAYDLEALYVERKAVQDEINRLQAEVGFKKS